MWFDFGVFLHFVRCTLFRAKKIPVRLTPRYGALLATFYLLFPPFELLLRIGFGLDDLFFDGYRRQPIEKPVFIIGNPRSGTTFLHRLLARDRSTFTTMHIWEILFTPSVIGRKWVWALSALDRWLGGPLSAVIYTWEERGHSLEAIHPVGPRVPEEDQYLMVHSWSGMAGWLYTALLHKARPYIYFDTAWSEGAKGRVMAFYESCVRRHLYAHGGADGSQHYLSKSPPFSSMVDALYDRFPTARVIYLVRNPLDVIPSYLSLLEFTWHMLGVEIEGRQAKDFVLQMARHWYRYPLRRLEQAPQDCYIIVRFDDMVADPEGTVHAIYRRFGFELSPAYARELLQATERSRHYRSQHEYSLEEMGLTRQEVVREFADVFERFGFDAREDQRLMVPTVASQRPR